MLVLVLLLLVVIAVVGLLVGRGILRVPEASPAQGQPPPATTPQTLAPARAEAGRQQPEQGAAPPGARSLEYPRELLSRERFEGTGSLHVHLEVDEQAAPATWTLVLEPSRVLIGGEHARAQTRTLAAGERSVELMDVPLGGYAIRAQAPGLNGPVEHVMLAKPDETRVVVRVRLAPAGFVQGRVVDAEGRGVEGLTVVLEPLASGLTAPDARRLTALTDAGGAYTFEGVLDGEYRLLAGSAELPLAPPRELQFQAPSLSMPELRVPLLGELLVQVRDGSGLPLEGAHVLGWGQEAGRFEQASDALGQVRARFLPAGRYTVVASLPAGGQRAAGSARAKVELAAGQRQELELRLEP